MREVQRLPDDVILVWYALPLGMTVEEFSTLTPSDQASVQLGHVRNRMPSASLNRTNAVTLAKTTAARVPTNLPSAEWHLVALLDARQFTTLSGNLDNNDVAIDGGMVLYKDVTGDYAERPLADVVIVRDASKVIVSVTKRVRP